MNISLSLIPCPCEPGLLPANLRLNKGLNGGHWRNDRGDHIEYFRNNRTNGIFTFEDDAISARIEGIIPRQGNRLGVVCRARAAPLNWTSHSHDIQLYGLAK